MRRTITIQLKTAKRMMSLRVLKLLNLDGTTNYNEVINKLIDKLEKQSGGKRK